MGGSVATTAGTGGSVGAGIGGSVGAGIGGSVGAGMGGSVVTTTAAGTGGSVGAGIGGSVGAGIGGSVGAGRGGSGGAGIGGSVGAGTGAGTGASVGAGTGASVGGGATIGGGGTAGQPQASRRREFNLKSSIHTSGGKAPPDAANSRIEQGISVKPISAIVSDTVWPSSPGTASPPNSFRNSSVIGITPVGIVTGNSPSGQKLHPQISHGGLSPVNPKAEPTKDAAKVIDRNFITN